MQKQKRLAALSSVTDHTNNQSDVAYSGTQIHKQKVRVNPKTGEIIQRYNAVYIPETPKFLGIEPHKDFTKVFSNNKKVLVDMVRREILSIYDLAIFDVLETLLSCWENNVVCDRETKQYITGTDISRMLGLGRNAINNSLNKLNAVGAIHLFHGKKNQKYILVNPYIVYHGRKITQDVLDIFNNSQFRLAQVINFEIKEYVDIDEEETILDIEVSPFEMGGLKLSDAPNLESLKAPLECSTSTSGVLLQNNSKEAVRVDDRFSDNTASQSEEKLIAVRVDDSSKITPGVILDNSKEVAAVGSQSKSTPEVILDDDAQYMLPPEEREFDLFTPKALDSLARQGEPVNETQKSIDFPAGFAEKMQLLLHMFQPVSSTRVYNTVTNTYFDYSVDGLKEVVL